ncbi:MAG: hypothetical protein FWG44_08525 [Oscillospiraceae bacterium]|nr:hypothetical protein [Oscillospiraceae bacterium]
MHEKIKELFKDHTFYEDEFKISIELDKAYSALELLKKYDVNQLYKTHFIEFWAFPEEEKNRFVFSGLRKGENPKYEVSYRYSLDANQDRNFYAMLNEKNFLELPIKNEKIDIVDFYYKDGVVWDFIQEYQKYPELDFILGNMKSNIHFRNSGYSIHYKNEQPTTFEMASYQTPELNCTFEYIKYKNNFILKVLDKSIQFDCIFKDRWFYSANGNTYKDISEILKLIDI